MRTTTVLHPHEHSFGFEHGRLRPTSSPRSDLLTSFPSKCSDRETSSLLRRRSIYQSSKSVMDSKDNTRKKTNKIKYSSSGIIDSLCNLDQTHNSETPKPSPSAHTKNPGPVPLKYFSKTSSISNFTCSHGDCGHNSATEAEPQHISHAPEPGFEKTKKISLSCEMETFHFPREPNDAGLCTSEGDAVTVQINHFRKMFHKFPHHGSDKSEHNLKMFDGLPINETKFNHIRKMFDEFAVHGNKTAEAKSYHIRKISGIHGVRPADFMGPLVETATRRISRTIKNTGNKKKKNTSPTPLLRDFSTVSRDNSHSVMVPYTAAYLQGWLKLEQRHGHPVFEFSMSISDDVLVTAVAMGDRPFDWVYSFHSFTKRKKTSPRFSSTPAPVGLMRVSCFNGGSDCGSLLREFVMYEFGRGRRDLQERDCQIGSPESSFSSTIDYEWDKEKLSSSSSARGEEPLEHSPGMEIASIVVQVPPRKKEAGGLEEEEETMVVVTPAGSHGFPRIGSRRPSPLLERWRSGGGCDCGGWDMGCPLSVFFSRSSLIVDGSSEPVHLFFQEKKVEVPALVLKMEEKGRYMVEFHAQLSRLQVLSICIAILHGVAVGERRVPSSSSSSKRSPLKQLFEEDD